MYTRFSKICYALSLTGALLIVAIIIAAARLGLFHRLNAETTVMLTWFVLIVGIISLCLLSFVKKAES